MSAPPTPPAPSYLLVGPPDLLHDIVLDFLDVGWEVSAAGWRAVISAPPADGAAPAPEWPTEITLSGVRHAGHESACSEHFGGSA